jgi:hypothetical protein
MADAIWQLRPVPHCTSIAKTIILHALWPCACAVALSAPCTNAEVRLRSFECDDRSFGSSCPFPNTERVGRRRVGSGLVVQMLPLRWVASFDMPGKALIREVLLYVPLSQVFQFGSAKPKTWLINGLQQRLWRTVTKGKAETSYPHPRCQQAAIKQGRHR